MPRLCSVPPSSHGWMPHINPASAVLQWSRRRRPPTGASRRPGQSRTGTSVWLASASTRARWARRQSPGWATTPTPRPGAVSVTTVTFTGDCSLQMYNGVMFSINRPVLHRAQGVFQCGVCCRSGLLAPAAAVDCWCGVHCPVSVCWVLTAVSAASPAAAAARPPAGPGAGVAHRGPPAGEGRPQSRGGHLPEGAAPHPRRAGEPDRPADTAAR